VLADRTPCVPHRGDAYGDGSHAAGAAIPPGRPASRVNSFNHGGRGQNVGFVGGQVSWATVPTVGPEGDNIYTVWLGEDRRGGVISLHSMPKGPTDSFLVP
jgi:hypothetical protein